jgi:hypothetical protein
MVPYLPVLYIAKTTVFQIKVGSVSNFPTVREKFNFRDLVKGHC